MERSTKNPKKIRPIQPHNACAVGPHRVPDVPSTPSDIQQSALLTKAIDIPDTVHICHFCSETLPDSRVIPSIRCTVHCR